MVFYYSIILILGKQTTAKYICKEKTCDDLSSQKYNIAENNKTSMSIIKVQTNKLRVTSVTHNE